MTMASAGKHVGFSSTVFVNGDAPGRKHAVAVKMAAMNVSGRFNAHDAKSYGQKLIAGLLTHQPQDLFFGQQAATKMDLPDNYGYAGETKTFIAYDSAKFKISTTDLDYKRQLREREQRGQIPRRYIRDSNYTICRVHMIESPSTELVLISWLTEESGNAMKNHTAFKRMTSFVTSLARDEQVPVIVGGTFRLAAEYARSIAPKSFVLYDRGVETKAHRESSMFVCSDSLQFYPAASDVACPSKLSVEDDIWVKTCDMFYWDPLFANVDVYVSLQETADDEPDSTPCNGVERNGTPTMANGVDDIDGGRGDDKKEPNGNAKNGYFGTRKQTNAVFTPDELYDESLVQNAPTCYIS